jgi:hypothetical protein
MIATYAQLVAVDNLRDALREFDAHAALAAAARVALPAPAPQPLWELDALPAPVRCIFCGTRHKASDSRYC